MRGREEEGDKKMRRRDDKMWGKGSKQDHALSPSSTKEHMPSCNL